MKDTVDRRELSGLFRLVKHGYLNVMHNHDNYAMQALADNTKAYLGYTFAHCDMVSQTDEDAIDIADYIISSGIADTFRRQSFVRDNVPIIVTAVLAKSIYRDVRNNYVSFTNPIRIR